MGGATNDISVLRGEVGMNASLPLVRSALSPPEVLVRLDAASRRGRLAGYVARGASEIEVTAFGEPFDHDLRGALHSVPSEAGGSPGTGTTIRCHLRMRPKVPALFVLIIGVSVWPGVWLTHSMLVTYFSWYTIQTWWWYIPLTVVPLFWMVPRMVKKSRAAVRASALEQIEKIRDAVDGVVVLP